MRVQVRSTARAASMVNAATVKKVPIVLFIRVIPSSLPTLDVPANRKLKSKVEYYCFPLSQRSLHSS